MPVLHFTLEEKAHLYEEWCSTRTGTCPDCGGVVSSKRQGRARAARTRVFTCEECRKTGTYLVPNEFHLPGEEPLDPGPNKLLGRD